MGGAVISAHGLGGARDLPVSPMLAIAGAVAALTVSFTVLALAWRNPRYDGTEGRPAPRWLAATIDSAGFRTAARILGLLLFGYTLWALLFGKDLLINPVFGLVYVLLWVGLVPASLLLGPVWRALNPFRTITRAVGGAARLDLEHGVADYPAWLGHWPAALGLFSFVWMELVSPTPDELGTLRLWIASYAAVMLVGGTVFGQTWFENADPFEVYSSLVARLSVWARREDQLVVRSPLANLHETPPRAGLVAVVSVLFGSTVFDSFKDSTAWLTRVQASGHPGVMNNLGLVVTCLVIGGVFCLGTMATAVRPPTRRRDLPRLFAHSVVPIIVGYVCAHYLSFLLISGQTTLIRMSDPMSTGANIFGTANWAVDYWIANHPAVLANVKVLSVVAGHVLGVVAAHDRAIALLPKRHQLTGQLPLLFTMIGFTAGGLYLLFSA